MAWPSSRSAPGLVLGPLVRHWPRLFRRHRRVLEHRDPARHRPGHRLYGATHGIILLFLQGKHLIAELTPPGYRKTLGLDENGVQRIRATVTRAAATMPTLILIALAPREGGEVCWRRRWASSASGAHCGRARWGAGAAFRGAADAAFGTARPQCGAERVGSLVAPDLIHFLALSAWARAAVGDRALHPADAAGFVSRPSA